MSSTDSSPSSSAMLQNPRGTGCGRERVRTLRIPEGTRRYPKPRRWRRPARSRRVPAGRRAEVLLNGHHDSVAATRACCRPLATRPELFASDFDACVLEQQCARRGTRPAGRSCVEGHQSPHPRSGARRPDRGRRQATRHRSGAPGGVLPMAGAAARPAEDLGMRPAAPWGPGPSVRPSTASSTATAQALIRCVLLGPGGHVRIPGKLEQQAVAARSPAPQRGRATRSPSSSRVVRPARSATWWRSTNVRTSSR